MGRLCCPLPVHLHFQKISPLKSLNQMVSNLMWPPGVGRTKSCSSGLAHMTNMAAMPIYGKNLKKCSSLGPVDL